MKAHRTDLVSLAFGLTFLALAVWWLLARILGLTLPPVGWFLAGALILIGLLGLVGALRSGRDAQQHPAGPEPEATVAAPYLEGTPTTGGPTAPEADEWATEAVTDVPVGGRVEDPFAGEPAPFHPPGSGDATGAATAGELPTVEPAAAADDATGPATRELPVVDLTGDTDPATRETPVVDAPEGSAGDRRADGDGPGRPERPAG